MNTLPNELVDCILDNLDPSIDKSTLLNCALVEKTWVGASQRMIFQNISLQIPTSESSWYQKPSQEFLDGVNSFLVLSAQLVASFEEKPDLASYVRCLELRGFVDETLTHGEWDTLCDSATRVLRQLSNVEKISLVWNCWNHLSPTLKMALIGIFTPLVTEITLVTFDMHAFVDLVSLLNHLTHLEVLRVLDSNCRDWDISTHTGTTNPPPRSVQLRELVLDNPDFMNWFQQGSCPFGLEKLQSLQISHHMIADHQIASMLQQIGGSLVKLKLQSKLPSLSDPGLVHVGYTPNLTCLELTNVCQGGLLTPVPWLRSLFEPVKQYKHSLQYLTIELRVSTTTDSIWNHWTAFDQLLRNPEFDKLELVHFRTTRQITEERLFEKLPFLNKSGRLKISA